MNININQDTNKGSVTINIDNLTDCGPSLTVNNQQDSGLAIKPLDIVIISYEYLNPYAYLIKSINDTTIEAYLRWDLVLKKSINIQPIQIPLNIVKDIKKPNDAQYNQILNVTKNSTFYYGGKRVFIPGAIEQLIRKMLDTLVRNYRKTH